MKLKIDFMTIASFAATLLILYAVQSQMEVNRVMAQYTEQVASTETESETEVEENPLLDFDNVVVSGDEVVSFIKNSLGNAVVITNQGVQLSFDAGIDWSDDFIPQVQPYSYKATLADESTVVFVFSEENSL